MSNDMFKYIDQGASRVVYELNSDLVIKIAKDQHDEASWGIQQCITELEAYIKYGDKLPLCKIMVDSSDKTRIIMEKVQSYNLMKNLPDDYIDTLDLLIANIEHYPENVEDFLKQYPNEKFIKFAQKFQNSGLTQDEIRDILYDVGFSNLGENSNGEIVILDYGMKYF